jgi:hypothetical protein
MKLVRCAGILLLTLLFLSGCNRTPKVLQHKSVRITMSGTSCQPDQDPVKVNKRDDIKWTGGGHFQVTFDKGDGRPCTEADPFPADGTKACSIADTAEMKIYRYKITNKHDGTVCADPSVEVQN